MPRVWLLALLVGCHSEPRRPRAAFANPCDSPDPLFHCDKSDPVVCERDADCEAPPCGPCTPGEIITRADAGLSCTVASCNVKVVCSPDHVCRVR